MWSFEKYINGVIHLVPTILEWKGGYEGKSSRERERELRINQMKSDATAVSMSLMFD